VTSTFSIICAGARGYSICQKVKASIKSKNKEVRQGQLVRIDIRLINRSGGDIQEGRWTMMLPAGVNFGKASTDAVKEESPGLIVYERLNIYAQKALYFIIAVKIEGATGSVVFRSFLNDRAAYCEATSALTVRIYSLPTL